MISRLRHVIATSADPYRNLALEGLLLDRVGEGECILYLWQNQRTVVIGRNQNPWAECRVQLLEEEGGRLARRLSGGGAVYHDLGNLNFTFLSREEDHNVRRQMDVVLHALTSLGVGAVPSGRNDILVDGRKCSGSAFYRSGARSLHHGTLLVDADGGDMSRYLTVDPSKLAAKGVASVRARVVNLKEVRPALTVERLRDQLIASFQTVYALPSRPMTVAEGELAERTAFFASWDWRLGKALPFTAQAKERFGWGDLHLRFAVEGGVVTRAELYSDGLEADLLAAIPQALTGCRYDPAALRARLSALPAGREGEAAVLADAAGLILRHFNEEEGERNV